LVLLLLASSGLLIFILNFFILKFHIHGFDLIHIPFLNHIYLNNFNNHFFIVASFVIIISSLYLSFVISSFKKIIFFSVTPFFLVNLYVIFILHNMNSVGSSINASQSEKNFLTFSNYLNTKYDYDNFIFTYNRDESWTIQAFQFVMNDNWKRWRQVEVDLNTIVLDNFPVIPNNSLIISKEKNLNLFLSSDYKINNINYFIYKNDNFISEFLFSFEEFQKRFVGNSSTLIIPAIYFPSEKNYVEIKINKNNTSELANCSLGGYDKIFYLDKTTKKNYFMLSRHENPGSILFSLLLTCDSHEDLSTISVSIK